MSLTLVHAETSSFLIVPPQVPYIPRIGEYISPSSSQESDGHFLPGPLRSSATKQDHRKFKPYMPPGKQFQPAVEASTSSTGLRFVMAGPTGHTDGRKDKQRKAKGKAAPKSRRRVLKQGAVADQSPVGVNVPHDILYNGFEGGTTVWL